MVEGLIPSNALNLAEAIGAFKLFLQLFFLGDSPSSVLLPNLNKPTLFRETLAFQKTEPLRVHKQSTLESNLL